MDDKKYKLILGDCLEEMKNIPDKSVDLILCDLPYGTTTCSWDTIIPFDLLWIEYNRIIKPHSPIVLFGSQPFTSALINSNISNFREEIIWLKNKAGSGMQANQKHIKIHENIIVFCNESRYTYNPQKWLIEDKEFITQRKTFKDNEYIGNQIYGATTRTRKPDTGLRNPISIISCRVPFTPAKTKTYTEDVELRLHPTQKPIGVCEYLIKTFSNDGDLILDNCMGSGTTGIAALQHGRRFIGIELDETYFDIAKRRIEERLTKVVAEDNATNFILKKIEK